MDGIRHEIQRNAVLFLAIGLLGGFLIGRTSSESPGPPASVPQDAEQQFTPISQAWNLIRNQYIAREDAKNRQLADGGMTRTLADFGHTRFLTPDMVEQQRQFRRGEFEGIGAEVRMKDGSVTIVAPLEGSPASETGLAPGDVILERSPST